MTRENGDIIMVRWSAREGKKAKMMGDKGWEVQLQSNCEVLISAIGNMQPKEFLLEGMS